VKISKLNRETAQVFEGAVSVAANAVLFAVKLWAGLTTGSIALMADAWHTMSDSATSVFVVVAAKLASKKPDKKHPFGHGRWELIASIIMAFALSLIAYEFMDRSIERLMHREESVVFGTLAIVITVVSIIIKEALAQFGFYLGKKYNNPVITADGWHSRSDSLSSLIVLIGIVISRFISGLWWMDAALGMFGALAIVFAAFQIMRETVHKILGEAAEPEFVDELTEAVNEMYENDLQLHHIHLHNYITHKELTLHIRLDRDMTIEKGHDIATVIENMLEEKFNVAATIHVEPIENN
jgi:cation diffusion facilitator family transporter